MFKMFLPRALRRFVMSVGLALSFAGHAAAQSDAQYQQFLRQQVWPQAQRAGVSQQVFSQAFAQPRLLRDLPVLSGGGQAEFGAPGRYFNGIGGTINSGRQQYGRYQSVLANLERQTGVPGHIAIAIWGRESAYGRASIPYNVFDVLGTRAFISNRREHAFGELIAALQVAQTKGVAPAQMRSSWAGAMGQPQFLPSSVLRYAVDGDGDRRADIWNSEIDTLASISNYLARHGWQRGRDWGFEVIVPQNISCTLEGPDQGRRISDWQAMGVRRANGRPFPNHELRGEGYLMMPAGRYGPAFIVTPNFYVLKKYNESDLYALFVGHAGDRIAYGGGGFAAQWQNVGNMSRNAIANMQRALVAQGMDVGGADGLPGFKTRRSIGRWQEARGEAATCFPTSQLLSRF